MAVDNKDLVYLLDPVFQIEGVAGKPVVAGHIEVFYAGTDVKYITWQNFDGTRNPFKIPLNNDGRAVILVEPQRTFDVYIYDSFNNLVCSRLNVRPSCGGDISISGGIYDGIDPIVVNNDVNLISANHVPLGVQDPLYFVQDDEEGCIIGISGGTGPIPEGTMNESALGYQNGQITGYNGSAFGEGVSYEAGSYIDIDGNTINVTGVQSAGDYVVYDDLSAYATEDWVEQQSYMKEYMESAFYPATSNPSGYLTEHQDLSDYAKTEDLSAYQEKGNYYSASNPSGFVNSDAISAMATTGFVADVSGDITALIPTDLFTKESADTLYYPLNSNPNGYLSAETDWSDTITAASANAYSEATAAIPTGLATTGDLQTVSGEITAMIPSTAGLATEDWVTGQGYITNDAITGKQDITGMTAYQAAGDYYSATNPSGFITGVDLTPYQLTADMTAYQPVGDYLTTADSGEFYTTANESGFITGVDLTPYQTTAGMTAYQLSGDYLTTGDSANFYTTANESGFITGVDLAPYQTTAGMTAYQTTAGMSNYATTGDLSYVSGVVGDVESLLASL